MNPLDKTSPSRESLASFVHSTVLRYSCLLQQGSLGGLFSLRSHSQRQERIAFLEAATSLLNVYKSICGHTVISIHTNKNSCAGISVVMFPTACFQGGKKKRDYCRIPESPYQSSCFKLIQEGNCGFGVFFPHDGTHTDPTDGDMSGSWGHREEHGSWMRLLSTGDGGLPFLRSQCCVGLAHLPGLPVPRSSQSQL